MSTLAPVRGVRLSPQKGRLVADSIRGLAVEKALDTLRFQTNKGAGIVKNLLESAIANAEHNDGVDIDDLFVEKIRESVEQESLSAPPDSLFCDSRDSYSTRTT